MVPSRAGLGPCPAEPVVICPVCERWCYTTVLRGRARKAGPWWAAENPTPELRYRDD